METVHKGDINTCQLINLPLVTDTRGSLVYLQKTGFLDFSVKRVYFLFDLTTGSSRGGHAHYDLDQLLVAVSGSMTINLDDGKTRKTIFLNDPSLGLRITPMIWRDITNISSNAVCLVLASREYDELDYIRDYETFSTALQNAD